MSESRGEYKASNEKLSKEILWLAKRLGDIASDLSKLSEDEQTKVIKRTFNLSPAEVMNLYNTLSYEIDNDQKN